jgi:hypothetical protein
VDDVNYAKVIRRIRQISLILAVIGTFAFGARGDRHAAISFAGGAAIASLSFFLLHRLVADMGAAMEGKKTRGASFVLHSLRLVVLGGAVFGMVKVYGASVSALGAGLAVPVLAITLEALYELTYARD